jgi:hypothetical protein
VTQSLFLHRRPLVAVQPVPFDRKATLQCNGAIRANLLQCVAAQECNEPAGASSCAMLQA